MTISIRPEEPADRSAVRVLVEAAFAPAEPGGPHIIAEAVLIERVRRDQAWIPQLTLVAERDGSVVGQVTSSYGTLTDPLGRRTPLAGVGPVAVHPRHQGIGVGRALMQVLIETADAAGEPALVLLGAEDYYRRFGFESAQDVGIEPPDPLWGRHFQVRRLASFRDWMVGEYRYAEPFQDL